MLNDVPRFPLYIHLLSAVVCMGISSIFHLFYCHSSKCNSYLCRFDYAGISLLIGGSNFSPNYYGWYCKEYKTQLFLFLGIIESSCLLAFFISLHPKFYSPSLRKWWAFLYIFIGVFGAFPGIYYYFSDPSYVPSL
jgi:adiponectin receptor